MQAVKAPSGNAALEALEFQVRDIRTIASKAGISLASELDQGFVVRYPVQLIVSQASPLIDSMMQSHM